MGKLWLAILAGALLAAAPVDLSWAAVYVYVDPDGVSHYTDAPTKPTYRRLPAFGLPRGADLTRGPYADLIRASAVEHGVDPGLVKAIIRAESNFDRQAVSRKGAQGLMQLMPDTAFRYRVRNPFDPADNIRGGVQYLRFLHETFPGRLPLIVAAYNAGENAVLRHGGIPPYRETQQYVSRVLRYYGQEGLGSAVSTPPRPAGPTGPAPAPSAQIYRHEAADGTVSYSNVPPLAPSRRSGR